MDRFHHRSLTGVALALLGAILLSACSSAPVLPQPSADLRVLKVALTSELDWLAADLNTCAQAEPGLYLDVNPLPAGPLDPTSADLLIFWGSETVAGSQAYELGNETLQVIVNPTNPADSITTAELVAILGGKVTDWSAIQPDSSLGAIQAWIYPDGLSGRSLIDENILQSNRLDPETLLAPGPQEMRQAVAAAADGIGFLPSHWIDASVKAIPVSDLSQGMSLPILAMTAAQPSGDLRNLLLCLQPSSGQ